MSRAHLPLLAHPLDHASAFTPEALIAAVRTERGLEANSVPPVCVLEFDGDLTDWLVSAGRARPCNDWACFHTTMYMLDVDGCACGIVPRTIGGPYAVLVAEQLRASGARIIVGLTSAGRVAPSLPVPSLVVATRALRDEGTSYHYLPPGRMVEARHDVTEALLQEARTLGLPVTAGLVWTTDAPYREAAQQPELNEVDDDDRVPGNYPCQSDHADECRTRKEDRVHEPSDVVLSKLIQQPESGHHADHHERDGAHDGERQAVGAGLVHEDDVDRDQSA